VLSSSKQDPGPQFAQQVPFWAPSVHAVSRPAGQDTPVGTDNIEVKEWPWYDPLLQSSAGTWHLWTVGLHEPDAQSAPVAQVAP
jgi:hypothetical protein